MLSKRELNAIWMELRQYLELVESIENVDWDDDLGIVTESYDIYSYNGEIDYKGTRIYFDVEAKYIEHRNEFYDIKVEDCDVLNNDDYFSGYDAMNDKYQWYQLMEAFDSAERNIRKK